MVPDHSKKRKHPGSTTSSTFQNTAKPSATYQPTQGRSHTISIALPGSIIANAQTHDLKTILAGSIARASTVFSVDEIVVFNDGCTPQPSSSSTSYDARREKLTAQDAESGYTAFADPDHFLWHILSYLETPPYLRRALCGFHSNLRTAGTLQSLDAPHHLRNDEWRMYREGVTLASHNPNTASDRHGKPSKKRKKDQEASTSSPPETLVNAGLPHPVSVPANIHPNTRVTVEFSTADPPADIDLHTRKRHTDEDFPTRAPIPAQAVHPGTPRTKAGYYWGYTVRTAPSLSSVLTTSPYDDTGGYDFVLGTSERGEPLRAFLGRREKPRWKHLLVVFGGLAGLEAAVGNDEALWERGVRDAKEVFDAWVDLMEGGQGSRTVRTEEAVWVGLMGLRGFCAEGGA